MTNTYFRSIEEVPDVSAQNQYRNRTAAGMSDADAMALINRAARDHARTPVQWTDEVYGGFSTAEPWFAVNPNYRGINVAAADADADSVLNFYRKAIALRRAWPVIREGSYREFKRASSELYLYAREMLDERVLVMCSFVAKPTLFHVPPEFDLEEGTLELCNYEGESAPAEPGYLRLRPYECRVYHFDS